MFIVKYLDDFHRIHLVTTKRIQEFEFIKERFEIIHFEPIKNL